MRSFWTKIGLGAVGVFVVGMFIFTLARQGIGYARGLVRGESLSVPLAIVPFELDGIRQGTFRRVEVMGARADRAKRVRITVKVPSVREARALSECAVAVGADGMGRGNDFACLSPEQVEAGDFVRIGDVVFQPGNLVRPLLIDSRRFEGHVPSEGSRQVQAQADLTDDDLRVSASASTGETLRLHAGDGNAVLVIRDADGKSLVNLTADEAGGILTVRGKDGRKLVDIRADTRGLSRKH